MLGVRGPSSLDDKVESTTTASHTDGHRIRMDTQQPDLKPCKVPVNVLVFLRMSSYLQMPRLQRQDLRSAYDMGLACLEGFAFCYARLLVDFHRLVSNRYFCYAFGLSC